MAKKHFTLQPSNSFKRSPVYGNADHFPFGCECKQLLGYVVEIEQPTNMGNAVKNYRWDRWHNGKKLDEYHINLTGRIILSCSSCGNVVKFDFEDWKDSTGVIMR